MQAQFIDGIFYVAVLIMSVVIHEVAHGYMAYRLGDNTARDSGRLTLNPINHLELFGSIILPLFLIISNAGFVIGWAKPVPYNPNNLNNIRKGTFLVSIAGILANLFLALSFGFFIRFAPELGLSLYIDNGLTLHPFYKISAIIVFTNLVLAFFNLIPIPPLDGSKILFSALSPKYRYIENFLERFGIFLLIFFIIFIWGKIAPILGIIFSLITGLN
jgi:Zn-dependent protease